MVMMMGGCQDGLCSTYTSIWCVIIWFASLLSNLRKPYEITALKYIIKYAYQKRRKANLGISACGK